MNRKICVIILAASILTSCGSASQDTPVKEISDTSLAETTASAADTTVSSAAESEQSVSAESTSEQTSDTVNVQPTETVTETEEIPVSEKDTDVSGWTSLYREFIKEQNALYYEDPGTADECRRSCFSLYDITGDSIPELIIPEGNGHFVGVCIYTCDGTEVKEIKADSIPENIERLGSWGNISYSRSLGCIAASNSVGGYKYSAFYQLSGDELKMTDSFDVPYMEELHNYRINSAEVSLEEFIGAMEKYNNADDWITLGLTNNPNITVSFKNADDLFDKIDEDGEYCPPEKHSGVIIYDDPAELENTDMDYLDDLLRKYILAEDHSNEDEIFFLMTDAVYFSVPEKENDYLFGQGAMNNVLVNLTQQQVVYEGYSLDELGCFSNFGGDYLCGCAYQYDRTYEFIYSLTNDRLMKDDNYMTEGEKVNSDEYILDSCGINTAVFVSGQEFKIIGD